MSYIEQFKKLFKVPMKIYSQGNEDEWTKFESSYGIKFPKDYKMIINEYGTGSINNFLWILNPFDSDENINYSEKAKVMLDTYLEVKEIFPEDYEYSVYPEKEGLLPWGFTDNGDELYWQTNEQLDSWRIVIYESASSVSYTYDMCLTEFLYKLFRREIECPAFPTSLFEEEASFVAVPDIE